MGRRMDKLLYRITEGMPCRVIADETGPYLERYFVMRAFGVIVYLHRFVSSDPDVGTHNHPWPWACSLLLSGEYEEQRTRITRSTLHSVGCVESFQQVRWINWLTDKSFHRVLLKPGCHSWTLFIHRDKVVQDWGFLRYGRFKPYAYDRGPEDRAVKEGNDNEGRWWKHFPSARRRRGYLEAWWASYPPTPEMMGVWRMILKDRADNVKRAALLKGKYNVYT